MSKLFKFLKILLIILITIAILNDIGAYFYVVIVGHDTSDFAYMVIEVLEFLTSSFLIYKDKIFGDVLMSILALWSLQTALQLDHALFAWGLLNFAPQVVFSNILMLTIVIVCILHFILLIIRKTQNKNLIA